MAPPQGARGMNRRHLLRPAITAPSILVCLCLIVLWSKPAARLVWNGSASAPTGLYWLAHIQQIERGDFVLIQPPPRIAHFLADRRYLPINVPLMKHVAGLPGDELCRKGASVTVNSITVATAKMRDRLDRALPVWTGCQTIGDADIFLLNHADDSLDGRYFGPLPASGIIGRAHPLFIRNAPGQPLRWQGTRFLLSTMNAEKEH